MTWLQMKEKFVSVKEIPKQSIVVFKVKETRLETLQTPPPPQKKNREKKKKKKKTRWK